MKKISMHFGVLFLAALFLAQPKPAHAIAVSAVICTVNTFPCPNANVLDAGIRSNGVGILGANRYTVLPFVFDDGLANFSGNLMATDSQGRFIYIWGGGVGTDKVNAGFFLDVQISQTYITQAGVGQWSEFNRGGCNGLATNGISGVAATLGVNGNFLPVMGGPGDCSPFNFTGGPAALAVGNFTNLTALAQFTFAAGFAGQAINLPWGEDFPDPAITFSDPSDPENVPTPTDLPAGFIEAAPEPGTFGLLGGALCVASLWLRKRAK